MLIDNACGTLTSKDNMYVFPYGINTLWLSSYFTAAPVPHTVETTGDTMVYVSVVLS